MPNRLSLRKTAGFALCISLSAGLVYHSTAYAKDASEMEEVVPESVEDVSVEENSIEGTSIEETSIEETSSEDASMDSVDVDVDVESVNAEEPSSSEEEGDSVMQSSEETEGGSVPTEGEISAEEVDTDSQQADSQQPEIDEELYADLKTYLDPAALQLEEADSETFNLLLALVGENSEQKGYFDLEEWAAFVENEESCLNVRYIDDLWRQASNGTLGFSEQKRIYEASGDILTFYRTIGWVASDALETVVEWKRGVTGVAYVDTKEPNFDNPVSGHLPAAMYWEEDADNMHRDRRLSLFYQCGL